MVDWSKRVIQTKIVYYGPAMSGKTTSIRALFRRLGISSRLESIDTSTGRTLFFDYGSIEIEHEEWTLQIHIWSATGQDYYAATRPTILAGADGIIFVADSNPHQQDENRRCWEELKSYFGEKTMRKIPVIFALNKRDLTSAIEKARFAEIMGIKGKYVILETIATRGIHALDLLKTILQEVLEPLSTTQKD